MFKRAYNTQQSGFTYIELIMVSAITVLIFGAILVSFQFALELGYTSRVKLSAMSLANDRLEYFRSLPYDDVGVAAGFPSGTIPQNSSFVLNGFTINERVRVDYVDDPADGTGGSDSNIITTDYKQIKADYTWTLDGRPDELSLTSNIVPRSIETNVGGGTIRINVLDADNSLLEDADVQVLSSSSTFSYDVTNPTDASGAALFSVPADSSYQTFVTANIGGRQYSTSSTYVATPSNPIPVVAPFSVVESGISTLTFQIGQLSDLLITTFSSVVEDSLYEMFDDYTGLAATTTVVINTGDLVLEDTAGVYTTAGVAYLNPVVPTNLVSWETVRVVATVPTNTTYQIQFYTGSTTAYTLIPDTDLPGNSSGFTDTLIDISTLDPVLYPTTTVAVTLITTDTVVTPSVEEIEVYWRDAETPRTSIPLFVRGDKIIGTDTFSVPVYKSTSTHTADSNGEVQLTDIEFDTYTATTSTAYSLAMACPAHPYIVPAGSDTELELVYVAAAATTLRVNVLDSLGRAIPSASVRLERSGYDVTQTTGVCGQTFFSGGGLSAAADYQLTVTAPGYSLETVDPFDVTDQATTVITMTAS